MTTTYYSMFDDSDGDPIESSQLNQKFNESFIKPYASKSDCDETVVRFGPVMSPLNKYSSFRLYHPKFNSEVVKTLWNGNPKIKYVESQLMNVTIPNDKFQRRLILNVNKTKRGFYDKLFEQFPNKREHYDFVIVKRKDFRGIVDWRNSYWKSEPRDLEYYEKVAQNNQWQFTVPTLTQDDIRIINEMNDAAPGEYRWKEWGDPKRFFFNDLEK